MIKHECVLKDDSSRLQRVCFISSSSVLESDPVSMLLFYSRLQTHWTLLIWSDLNNDSIVSCRAALQLKLYCVITNQFYDIHAVIFQFITVKLLCCRNKRLLFFWILWFFDAWFYFRIFYCVRSFNTNFVSVK